MRIEESKIEEIRSFANIVDVVSEFVHLRKRGKNYLGLCPFHTEKTPSFTVSDEKQIYHCFGCHNGGNVFKFLMEYEKISFVEAVQELAEKLGIELTYDKGVSEEKQTEQELLYEINTGAARYFSNNLLNHEEGQLARQYFQERKIKVQTQRLFGLGYALNAWESFINYAKQKNVDIDKALDLGLIGRSGDGRLYDKFSGRIIFPVFSPNGRVVAFAGRLLIEKEGAAKYLNSPESLVYHKSRVLYGLSLSKDEIRRLDKAILVEGYMDLLSLYQNGVKNVVAVSGTALTEEQALLLSRYTKNVVLIFDADTAGIKASMRSIELLLKKDFEIKIASLPQGEDPDSYINNYGKEKFEELIKYAENFLEFQTAYFEVQGMFAEPAKTTEAIRELVKPVALIADELKRSLLIKNIAKKFNLREKLIEAELDRAILSYSRQLSGETKIVEQRREKELNKYVDQTSDVVTPAAYNLEKDIIKLLFEGDESLIELISDHISPEDFTLNIHKNLANLVYEARKNHEDIIAGALTLKLENEELQNYIHEITFEKYSVSKFWDEIKPSEDEKKVLMKFAKDTVKKFKLSKIDLQISQNSNRLTSAESEEETLQIMMDNRELEQEKIRISKALSS